MTFKEAVKGFIENNEPFNNYWALQLSWSAFTDSLARDNQITEKQRCNWGNPCTPENFKRFNKKFQSAKFCKGS